MAAHQQSKRGKRHIGLLRRPSGSFRDQQEFDSDNVRGEEPEPVAVQVWQHAVHVGRERAVLAFQQA